MGLKKEKHQQKSEAGKGSLDHQPAGKSLLHLNPRGWLFLLGLAAAILVIVIYIRVLHSPFLFDDIPNIRDNAFIRITHLSPGTLLDAGLKSIAANRPVANISFALNYYFHGYNVLGYHIVNIIVHLMTGLFLFLLLKETLLLTKRNDLDPPGSASINASVPAFAAALIWLVHPLHTQSVSYIVQRMTGMAAMFYVLSMLCYVRARLDTDNARKWILFGAGIVSGVLAIGSKEISVTLPFFILLYEWYFFQDLDTVWLKRSIPYLAGIIVIGVVLGLIFLGSSPWSVIEAGYRTREFTLTQRVLTEFRIVMMYLGLIFLPFPGRLSLDYDFPLSSSLISPPATLISLLTIIALIGLAVFIAKKDRVVSFAILWFFGNLVLESSVISLELVYEHRTYLPSMFVIFLAVVLLHRYLKDRWVQTAVFFSIVAVFSLWTWQRNLVWQDELTLFQDCVAKAPGKARTHNNFCLALLERGRVDEAVLQCRQAVDLAPDTPGVHNSLGTALMKKGDLGGAIAQFEKAISLDPKNLQFTLNLAKAMEKKGLSADALKHYAQVLGKEPTNVQALNGMGEALAGQGRYDDAMRYFTASLKAAPDSAETFNNMGNVLLMQGRIEDAQKHYLAAIRMNSGYKEAYYNLGMALLNQGRAMEGIKYLEKAVAASPSYEQARSSLAAAYYRSFNLNGSIRQFQEVLRINPANADAQRNLKASLDLRARLDLAIGDLRSQVETNPGNAELHYRLGDVLQRRGDLDSAAVELQKALSIRRLPQALHGMAVIHSLKEDYGKALDYLEEMRRARPDDPEVYYNLACIYSKQGNDDDALRNLQDAVKKGFNKWDVLKTDPDLWNVRRSQGYNELIKRK